MAVTELGSSHALTLGRIATAPFRALWNGMVFLAENNHRGKQIAALNALSDEQLAAKGLTRESITRHVFRDYMHL